MHFFSFDMLQFQLVSARSTEEEMRLTFTAESTNHWTEAAVFVKIPLENWNRLIDSRRMTTDDASRINYREAIHLGMPWTTLYEVVSAFLMFEKTIEQGLKLQLSGIPTKPEHQAWLQLMKRLMAGEVVTFNADVGAEPGKEG